MINILNTNMKSYIKIKYNKLKEQKVNLNIKNREVIKIKLNK